MNRHIGEAGADVVVAGGAAPRTKLVVGNWKMNGSVAANARCSTR
jgi:hypothetical protein